MSFDLSVVFPCYNEAGTLSELIGRLDSLIDGRSIQVILVDNGSTDNSKVVFEESLARCKNRSQFELVTIDKNIGYGHGIRSGLARTVAPVLAYSHADLQTDPYDLIRAAELFKKLGEDPRNPPGSFIVKGERRNRRSNEKLFSRGLDTVASIVLSARLHDINGQPKMFSRSFYESYLVKGPDDLSLDVYLMGAAARTGVQVHTVPVDFGVRKAGESSWNTTFRSKFRTVKRFLDTIVSVRTRLQQQGA